MAYEVDVICGNCGYRGRITIISGTTIINSPCPACGCKTLRRA